MFWRAIAKGFGQMGHWEIWVSILLFVLIYSLYYSRLNSKINESADDTNGQPPGLLKTALFGIVLQGLLVTIMVSALLPILIGLDGFSPIEFFQQNWLLIVKSGFVSIAITFILSFIPIVGNFITKLPGTAIFFQGIIVFHMLSNPALRALLYGSNLSKSLFPGIWASLGFVLFSIIAVFIFGFFISTIIKGILSKLNVFDNLSEQKCDLIIAHFAGIIIGILCLCIYSSYIRLTIIDTI